MPAVNRLALVALCLVVATTNPGNVVATAHPVLDQWDRAPTGPVARAETERSAPDTPTAVKNPKLDSQLASLAIAERERGAAAALADARERRLRVVEGQVQIVVERGRQDGPGPAPLIASAGGRVQAEYQQLVQALVPARALESLAAQPDVRYVRPPFRPEPDAVAGEGVGAALAAAWHSAGIRGTGVKIGIIDGGFSGYPARQAAGDLPASLTTRDFCDGQLTSASDHGTGVAEIIHEMAPGAQLYLICFATDVNLGQAKDYAKAEGIHVVNHSVSWFNTSRGDGSGAAGTPDAIVADARSSGILWVNSAGNRASLHWSGTFADANGNGWHDYTAGDEGNTFQIPTNAEVCATLKWDDWPTSSNDYDLYLKLSSDGSTVRSSTNLQSGSQRPTERLCYTNTTGTAQNFYLAIHKFNATANPRFDLFITTGSPVLEYRVAAGSVTEPASSPNALAAGAACWSNEALEPFSSQGPTIDGRTKPDMAGPDSVSSGTYGNYSTCGSSGFSGTSASAAHLTGAAALVKQANPGFTAAQIASFLQGRASDRGSPGMDNSFGSGLLNMGSAPSVGVSTWTTGVFRPSNGALYLKSQNATGFADALFTYGLPGDKPVVGDWTGKGYRSIGIFRNGTFFLRNSNTNGVADITFAFGAADDLPVAGDWNGDGVETVGVYRNGTFFLRNSNTSGPADITITLGVPGDVPIAGKWTGGNTTTVGVFRPSNGALYLRNSNTTGFADITLTYGLPGDKPVVGDWDGNGTHTIGVYRNGTFHLRNSNTNGFADLVFSLGIPSDEPIGGFWGALN